MHNVHQARIRAQLRENEHQIPVQQQLYAGQFLVEKNPIKAYGLKVSSRLRG